MNMEESLEIYSCTECDVSFTRQCKLEAHEKRHRSAAQEEEDPLQISPRELIIDVSPPSQYTKAVPRKRKMYRKPEEPTVGWTEKNGPNGKKFVCDECQQEFRRLTDMAIHARIHTGYRPHVCDICGKDFTQSSALYTHMRIHTDERPYRCKICKKRFRESSKVTRHLRVHTGEKPYICFQCGKGFTQSGTLKIHLLIHERPAYYARRRTKGKAFRKTKSETVKPHFRRQQKHVIPIVKEELNDDMSGQSCKVESMDNELSCPSMAKSSPSCNTEMVPIRTRAMRKCYYTTSEKMSPVNLDENDGIFIGSSTSAEFSASQSMRKDSDDCKLKCPAAKDVTGDEPRTSSEQGTLKLGSRCTETVSSNIDGNLRRQRRMSAAVPEESAKKPSQENETFFVREMLRNYPPKKQYQLRLNRRCQIRPRKLCKESPKESELEERTSKDTASKQTLSDFDSKQVKVSKHNSPGKKDELQCTSKTDTQVGGDKVMFFSDDIECIQVVVQTSPNGETTPYMACKEETDFDLPDNFGVEANVGRTAANSDDTKQTSPFVYVNCPPEDNKYSPRWGRNQALQRNAVQPLHTVEYENRNFLGGTYPADSSHSSRGVFPQQRHMPLGQIHSHAHRERLYDTWEPTQVYEQPPISSQNTLGLFWLNERSLAASNRQVGYATSGQADYATNGQTSYTTNGQACYSRQFYQQNNLCPVFIPNHPVIHSDVVPMDPQWNQLQCRIMCYENYQRVFCPAYGPHNQY